MPADRSDYAHGFRNGCVTALVFGIVLNLVCAALASFVSPR
jgi:hypothetical protein